jgi:rhodanese-related sulfurtransferase
MRTRLLALSAAALAAAALGLAGCSSADSASAPASASVQGPAAPVAAPAAPERVDAARFAEVVASPGVTTIDVRTPEEFAAGHIEGAVNYNVEGPDFGAQIAALDPAGTYAVYCRSGNRSQVAVAAMAQAGIPGIYELESGIVGWDEAGLPTVS